MTPPSENRPEGGLLGHLAAFETHHQLLELPRIVEALDEDPEGGWRLLVEKYSKFVYSVAWKTASGLSDPEEFAAEIYRRVFTRLEADDFSLVRRFRGGCDFRTYLFRMVRTERFRLFRRLGVERRGAETLEREEASAADPIPEEPSWATDVGRRAVQEALGELGPRERRILTLRFGAELKLRELAEAIGARDTNDAAYQLRKALARCGALARARGSPEWDEAAFAAAAEEFRRNLFAEDPQNSQENVSNEATSPTEDEL